MTCPYCKVTIAEGTGSGDSFPKIWLPFIRCHSCGGLIDTGSREFLTIPVEERLRLKNTGKNAEYIEHSVSRTNNKKYQDLLKGCGYSIYPLTEQDYEKFDKVYWDMVRQGKCYSEDENALYNSEILIKEEILDENTGGIKQEELQRRSEEYNKNLKSQKKYGALFFVIMFISLMISVGITEGESPIGIILGLIIGLVISIVIAAISDYIKENKEKGRVSEDVEANDDRDESNIYNESYRITTKTGEVVNVSAGNIYITCGTEWCGKRQIDDLYQIMGADFNVLIKSKISMKKFGHPKVVSWFTLLDGKLRGINEDYDIHMWKNLLSKDEEVIQEIYVGTDKGFVEKRYRENKHNPYRLVFQGDPENRGEEYRYRFLGWYELKSVDFNTGVHTFERVQKYGYLTDNPFESLTVDKPFVKTIGPESYIGAIVKNEKYGYGWIKGIENGFFLVIFNGENHLFTLSSIGKGLTVMENNNGDVIDIDSSKNSEFNAREKHKALDYSANGKEYIAPVENYIKEKKENNKDMEKITRSMSMEYGTNSRKIYVALCQKFNWDIVQQDNFGRQGARLYAENSTPEGYSVWFLGHNNWTNTKGSAWKNEISGDLVIETWEIIEEGLTGDYNTKRVIFAKKYNGQYVFLGVYEPIGEVKEDKDRDGKTVWKKTYKKISDIYPI